MKKVFQFVYKQKLFIGLTILIVSLIFCFKIPILETEKVTMVAPFFVTLILYLTIGLIAGTQYEKFRKIHNLSSEKWVIKQFFKNPWYLFLLWYSVFINYFVFSHLFPSELVIGLSVSAFISFLLFRFMGNLIFLKLDGEKKLHHVAV